MSNYTTLRAKISTVSIVDEERMQYTISLSSASKSDISFPLYYSGSGLPVLNDYGSPILATISAGQTSTQIILPKSSDGSDQLNLGSPSPLVNTDHADYSPGSTAYITANNFKPGATIEFQVVHVSGPGADGVMGTLDDTVLNTNGSGHESWYVTDGGQGDLDGEKNGSVETSWYVNPDDSLDATFLLTAKSVEAGKDKTFGTSDDVVTGQIASNTFTDSAGSYTLKFSAADPALNRGTFAPTYEKMTPQEYLDAGFTYPVGRANPAANNPLDNAVEYGPTFTSSNFDAVTSLAPKDMSLGQIVPFFVEINVSGSTLPENGVITFKADWLAKTTSGADFGFDTNYKVIAAFVDTGEVGNVDNLNLAQVDSFSSTILGAGTSNERIEGTFQVSGLNNGDNVIVEIWVVLDSTIPPGVSGNVQTTIESAHVGPSNSSGDKINVGNQTVPLLRVQEFFTSDADLSVIKSDSPDATQNSAHLTASPDVDPNNLKPGDIFTYTILATNNSSSVVANGVVVTDSLDPNVTFISASNSGLFANNGAAADTITWNLNSLIPGESQILTVTVQVNANAPTGSSTQDLLNSVSITAINNDPNLSNNTNSEPTNIFENTPPVINIEKTGPAQINEGGQDVTWHFKITNDSGPGDPVTVTSLTDDKLGDLLAAAQAANGNQPIVLQPGGSFEFDYNPAGVLVLDGGESQTNVVTVVGIDDEGVQDSANDNHTITAIDLKPIIDIEKTGPAEINEGGEDVTWHFKITNNSAITDPVTVTSLVDDKLGDLLAAAQAANGNQPIVLQPGGSFEFNYNPAGDLVLDSGESQTNVVTVIGVDDEGSQATDSDNHTITAKNLDPAINIEKSGPAQINEGGEDVTWHFKITNNSDISDPVTVTSLMDDKLGDLLAAAQAANGNQSIVLQPGGSFEFDYNPAGNLVLDSGESQTNIVTVIGVDDEGSQATDSDNHTITAINLNPIINIEKSGPAQINEGGQDVTWHFKITNNSDITDPITVTSLTDNKLGNLLAAAQAANGGAAIVLQPGQSFEFDYNPPGDLVLDVGQVHTNVVTVIGVDDEGSQATDSDNHTIKTLNLNPIIDIEKTGPAEINEGGEDVTWHFKITNNSAITDPVTVTSLVDDKLGDLLAAAIAENGGNPIVLQPGASFEFNYNPTGDLVLDAGESQTNVVTVIGVDDEGSQASDSDNHTITAKNLDPIIDIEKSGPAQINEGGEDVTWHFKITNNSNISDPITVTSLVDDKLGDLLAAAIAENGGNPIVLQPGASFEFNYNPPGNLVLDSGESQTNVVTVIGVDDEASQATDSDNHTITTKNLNPIIDIEKSGPDQINEGGQDVTWHFKITNNSDMTDPVTVTSLMDDKLGNLLAAAQAANGNQPIVLQPGGSFEFDYNPVGDLVLNVGQDHTNTVTVIGVDDEGTQATDSDSHTIKVINLNPIIDIEKSGPDQINEGGQDVTWHFKITNNSDITDPVTVTSLMDDKLGNLLAAAQAANGNQPIVLQPGGSFEFDYNPAGNLVLDAGQEHTNTVTVIGVDDEGTQATDSDNHTIIAKDVAPAINIEKTVDANKDGVFHDLENLSSADGKAIYKYEITNTSPASTDNELTITSLVDNRGTASTADDVNLLNGFVMNSSYGSYYVSGDADGDYKVDFGETWTFKADLTVPMGTSTSNTNTATVVAKDNENSSATDSDTATVKQLSSGLIAPTGTTPQQYINGTAPSFEDYYAAQGGVIQYNVKTSGKGSSTTTLINSTNPGVFFYYTGITGAIKGADGPDANTAPDPMSIRIDQSDNSALFPAFSISKSGVMLYKITDVNSNGIIDAGDTATKVALNSNQIVYGTGANAGDVTINFTPDAVGSMYIISVKYETGGVAGVNVGNNPAAWPTVHYDFKTDVGNNGTFEEASSKGINIAPKFGALTLDGEVGHAPAESLDKAALASVMDQALQYWKDQHISSEDLAKLMHADVRIMDLGGSMLAGTDEQHVIWIDDDAAGHGWSTDPNQVAADKIDLLSALTHEFGHILGLSDEQMDGNLAVGERHMPLGDAAPSMASEIAPSHESEAVPTVVHEDQDDEIQFVDASELEKHSLNFSDSIHNHGLDFRQLGDEPASHSNHDKPAQLGASVSSNNSDQSHQESNNAHPGSNAQNDQDHGKANEEHGENAHKPNNAPMPLLHASEVAIVSTPDPLPPMQQQHHEA